MAKELKIVKVIGYSVYPNLNIEKDGVKVERQVFECKDTGKSYVVLLDEDKQTLSSRFSLYNGIIPKDKCEKASPYYNRYAFDERMYMFTTDFDNEREFVEHGISTYYTLRCTKLEEELKRVRDVRAKALDAAKEQGFIDNKVDDIEEMRWLDWTPVTQREIDLTPSENKKEPVSVCDKILEQKESTNPCDWCTHGCGSNTCPIKNCYSWSRFNPIEGTPLFIEQKTDGIDW